VIKTLTEIKNNNFTLDNSKLNSPFSLTELQETVASMNSNSSSGPDNIPYGIIKEFPTQTLNLYLELINLSWSTGVIPNIWKEAFVIPIPKPNKDNKSLDSYRPISLINCLAKIMEKMVTRRLNRFLEANNLINKFQAGFRKNHSTVDQAVRLKTEAENAMQNGNFTIAIMLDFTRAFDLIWIDGLLLKLISLNITGKIYNWIKNFLENRKSKVKIQNAFSDPYSLDNGTPQGSSLSPTLFLIMINDFPELTRNTTPSLFADDSSIWRSGKNLEQISHHLQQDIEIIEKWCSKWGFVINPEKSVGIVFTIRKKFTKPKLILKNKPIRFESTCTLLGFIFDSKLSWKPYIKSLCERCNRRLNILRALSGTTWGASKNKLLIVYKALVRSLLDYGCLIYQNAPNYILKLLDSIQYKSLLTIVGGMWGTSMSNLLAECGELPLELRRKEKTLLYLNKLKFLDNNIYQNQYLNHICAIL